MTFDRPVVIEVNVLDLGVLDLEHHVCKVTKTTHVHYL
jgi:hypothetical protein